MNRILLLASLCLGFWSTTKVAAFGLPIGNSHGTKKALLSVQSDHDGTVRDNHFRSDRSSFLQCGIRDQRVSTSTSALYMGWGPDPVWSDASVVSVESACPSEQCVLVRLKVPSETFEAYQIPGQYVQVQPRNSEGVKPSFLAICSPPGSSLKATENDENVPDNGFCFDFLIKKTENNDWLTTSLAAGSTLQVSQVLGQGYAFDSQLDNLATYDFPTQNILLFATGSGIAPLVAAVESSLLQTKSRTCRLYYGARTADDLCFVERFAEWEANGVEVVPVLSQPDDSDWKGRTGYIQTALAEDGIAIPRNTGALLCGVKGMTESVKELLLASGVFEGRVLFNF